MKSLTENNKKWKVRTVCKLNNFISFLNRNKTFIYYVFITSTNHPTGPRGGERKHVRYGNLLTFSLNLRFKTNTIKGVWSEGCWIYSMIFDKEMALRVTRFNPIKTGYLPVLISLKRIIICTNMFLAKGLNKKFLFVKKSVKFPKKLEKHLWWIMAPIMH